MKTTVSLLVAAVALTIGLDTARAVPASFTFTGRLIDGATPVDGAVTLDLELYSAVSGGSPLWEETHDTTADNGLVAVPLGGQAPLDPADFDGGDLWLAITVNGTTLSPRFQLRSVPYAVRAEVCNDAEAVGGIPAAQVQQVLDTSCAVGSAIRSIDPAGVVTCEAVVAGGAGVPSGAISYFEVACPLGWSDYVALNGRVAVGGNASLGTAVGTQLAALGTRTVTDVPSHSHSADPPNTGTTTTGDHAHNVDPGSFTDSAAGSHSHSLTLGSGDDNTTLRAHYAESSFTQGTINTGSDGSHSHTVDVPNTASTTTGAHAHTVNVASFNTGSTGSGSVDVTMPYLQLRACKKD